MINSLFIHNHQSPGDICMLTAAIRDLKTAYPNLRVNVSTTAHYLWYYNPLLDVTINPRNADLVLKAEYPLIHKSNSHPYHFIHGFRIFLANALKLPIHQGPFYTDIYLNDREKKENIIDIKERYWIINAGYKTDFTNKMWELARYQQVVDHFKGKLTFVQVGELSSSHVHGALKGVIDLRGKTDGRKIVQLMYHASGVLTGCSYMMHLSTIETDPNVCRKNRPCVCILGGREPIQWVQQKNMICLHNSCLLDCNENGGCWRSRVTKIEDGDEDKNSRLCAHPVVAESGQTIPLCMDMITAEDVINKIEMCEKAYTI